MSCWNGCFKIKSSGFLAKREELDMFLDEIFKIDDMKISIKTRIGKDSPEEFYELIKIYNKYPLEELIIHPRIQKIFMGINLIYRYLKMHYL